MSHENSVLFQKISSDLAKSIQEKIKGRDLEWGKDEIKFSVNGGKKKLKLKIILE